MYQQNSAKLKQQGKKKELRDNFKGTWMGLSNIYKYHKISPFAPFKSPMIQIPIFFYFASDMRRIVTGLDLQLARDLSDGGVLWFTNLTDPDPWFALPILSGVLLYGNVEYAIGKKNLSGEGVGQQKLTVMMKDFFQSLSVFMPCFMATSPSGVQIYLCTSMVFTLFQSIIIRNESFRKVVGLPSRENLPKEIPELAVGFNQLKLLEQQAAKLRKPGDPIIGQHGVLADGWTTSFIGRRRKSSIDVGGSFYPDMASSGLFGTQLKNPSLVVLDDAALTPLQSNVPKVVKEEKKSFDKVNLSWKGKKKKGPLRRRKK